MTDTGCGFFLNPHYYYYLIILLLLLLLLYRRTKPWCLHGLTGSAVSHRSIAPRFKPRPSYVKRVFRLSLRLITRGARSVHLAYCVHKVAVKQQHLHFYIAIETNDHYP